MRLIARLGTVTETNSCLQMERPTERDLAGYIAIHDIS